MPDVKDLRKLILSEAHDTAYSIHPGSTKMYYDLKEHFWWRIVQKIRFSLLESGRTKP